MRTGGEGWTDHLLQNLEPQATIEGGGIADTPITETDSQAADPEPS